MTHELQKQHTPDDSAAGNWQAVASVLSAPIPQPGVKVSSRTTFAALVAAGHDPDKILAGFNALPSGSALIDKLNADAAGIDWSDQYTQFIVGRVVALNGDVTSQVAALLRGLSARSTTLAGGANVTAEQCQADWVAGFAAEEAATLATQKQGALSEANDVCIHVIADTPAITQADLLAAFAARLDETWPVEG